MAKLTREEVIKDLLELANDIRTKKFQHEFFGKLNNLCAKDIKIIFDNSILDYYNDYEPNSYKRKFSLYDMYSIKAKGDELIIELGPEFVKDSFDADHNGTRKTDRVQPEYIYDTMFKGGWHGGATFNPTGKMIDASGKSHPFGSSGTAWRTGNYFQLWDTRQVPRSPSVFEVIKSRLEDYQNNETNISGRTLRERQREAFSHALKKYKIFKDYKVR